MDRTKRAELARLRKIYAHTGSWYDLLDAPWEYFRYRKIRPLIWRRAGGAKNVLELGVGTGRNVEFYPSESRVTAIDLSEVMLKTAAARGVCAGREGFLCQASATDLPFRSASFDSAMATFLFCVLPNDLQPRALSEVARILRPGGKLVLIEYQYSEKLLRRALMKLMAPFVRWAYGAGFDRETARHLREGGWQIEEETFLSGDVLKLIVASPPG